VYLAIATFGFALLVQDLFFPSFLMFSKFTTALKAPRPRLGGIHTQTDTGYYYVVVLVSLLCFLLLRAVRRGRLGRLLRSMRDSSVGLDAHGTNTDVTRLLVFCLSAFVAGIGGAIISPVTGTVGALSYDFSVSLVLVAVLFLGGRQPVLGAFLAAGAFIIAPGYINSPLAQKYIPVVFGAGVVLVAMFGGLPIVDRIRASRRHREREHRSPVLARMLEPAEAVR
jgi:ABC-type branched-subunit amino acid transport system permease subunit